jgi:hypothetical protein
LPSEPLTSPFHFLTCRLKVVDGLDEENVSLKAMVKDLMAQVGNM